jgi:hypothetical protein
MLLDQVINEIKQLKHAPNRRSAIEIARMLGGNKRAFLQSMDPENFEILLQDFERLADAHATEYQNESYKRDFTKSYNLLMFYLEKIF